jgi:hypothetical protein
MGKPPFARMKISVSNCGNHRHSEDRCGIPNPTGSASHKLPVSACLTNSFGTEP